MESAFFNSLYFQSFARQSNPQANEYSRFASLMDNFGYEWEAFKVHTEDHYILSTFHILGKKGETRVPASQSKGSVLCQHGDM